jgi:hypothetical protein
MYGPRKATVKALILTGALGVLLGVTFFLGAMFASMPKARPALILGVDERIIGIPKNCDEARAAHIAPMARGTGFYTERLDWNKNGLACEPGLFDIFT